VCNIDIDTAAKLKIKAKEQGEYQRRHQPGGEDPVSWISMQADWVTRRLSATARICSQERELYDIIGLATLL
jgi:hypothetical protein